MDTIHEHCSLGLKKKRNKKNKIFVAYDLMYEIIVFHYL